MLLCILIETDRMDNLLTWLQVAQDTLAMNVSALELVTHTFDGEVSCRMVFAGEDGLPDPARDPGALVLVVPADIQVAPGVLDDITRSVHHSPGGILARQELLDLGARLDRGLTAILAVVEDQPNVMPMMAKW